MVDDVVHSKVTEREPQGADRPTTVTEQETSFLPTSVRGNKGEVGSAHASVDDDDEVQDTDDEEDEDDEDDDDEEE
jgi:hypothetical protein